MKISLLKNSKLVCLVGILLLSILPFFTAATSVHAAEDQPIIEIEKNSKWVDFENELSSRRTKRSLDGENTISQEEYFRLVEKYDGAKAVVRVNRAVAFSEQLVNGGYNAFATSRSGMESLRSGYGTTAALLVANGTVGGAMAGGPAGALVGAIGANVLAGYFRSANSDMKRWLDVGSSKGGCRITLTEEFPISSLGSTTQSAIKKL